MPPERAAMLLAFKTDDEVLTKWEIIKRADARNIVQFDYLISAGFVTKRDWRGPNLPREYNLTESGVNRRELLSVAENLKFGG